MNGRERRRVGLRRVVAAVLLVSMSACMMWRPVELSRITPEDAPDRVRLTRADSSSVVLEFPAVRGDSITGTLDGGMPASVALSDVQVAESWEVDPGFLFVPAIGAFLLLLANFPLDDPPTPGVPTDGP